MKQFTIEQARELIKRELGVDAASLTAPADMNGSPDYPWYGMSSGNQRIALYTKDVPDTQLIALSVSFENCVNGVTQFFYADTLEFADKATEARKWEDIADLTDGNDIGLLLRRLQQETLKAHREHTTHIGEVSAQAKKVWLEKMECIRSQALEKVDVLRDAERALHKELDEKKVPDPTTATPEIVQTPIPFPFQPLDSNTKEWIIGLWDEGEAKADDADGDLNDTYRAYLATVERWSAQGQPHLGRFQDGYGRIVDAIDTMLYYEAHPEEAARERVLAGTQQSKSARELDDVWDWEP